MSRLTLLAAVLLVTSGCTVRYSQTLVGRIARVDAKPIVNSDSGVEVGVGSGLTVIAFSEPMDARELAAPPCDIELVQVDYRGLWYAFYLAVNFPEVETRVICAARP